MLDPELGALVREVVQLPGFQTIGKRSRRAEKNGWYEVKFDENQWFIDKTLVGAIEKAIQGHRR